MIPGYTQVQHLIVLNACDERILEEVQMGFKDNKPSTLY